MNHDPDWSLLAKYFKGEASEEEVRAVEAWVEADPDHRRELDEAWLAWSATEKPKPPAVDTSSAWRRIKEEIDREEAAGAPYARKIRQDDRKPRSRQTATRSSRRTKRKSLFASKPIQGAGVGLVLLLAVSIIWFLQSPEAEVLATNKGERSTVELVDGTRVHLNADSRLTIPADFLAGERREVHLEGEAYFDVATDASRPFRVHARGVTARALGTAFNVQAYADGPAQVAVTEGTVELRMAPLQSEGSATQDAILLEASHLGIALEGELKAVREGVNLAAHVGWTDGQLVFEGASIDKVARKIERWYNLQVEVQVPRSAVVRLNATFDNEPITEVLASIAAALDLQYERDQHHVLFYRSASGSRE